MSASTRQRLRGLAELWDLRELLKESGPGVGLPLPLLDGSHPVFERMGTDLTGFPAEDESP